MNCNRNKPGGGNAGKSGWWMVEPVNIAYNYLPFVSGYVVAAVIIILILCLWI